MLAGELRSRIARSGISGKRLAELLGIPQPNVSGWCTGIRSIPTHHVAAIIRLTDNPPPRTEPAWRPPADMPKRSIGYHSKVSRRPQAARADRPHPQRQPLRPALAPLPRLADERSRLDLSVLNNLLQSALLPALAQTRANEAWSAGTTPGGSERGTRLSPRRRAPARPVIDPAPTSGRTGLGPQHSDFVAEHNHTSQHGEVRDVRFPRWPI
jgi:hypothetical protein